MKGGVLEVNRTRDEDAQARTKRHMNNAQSEMVSWVQAR